MNIDKGEETISRIENKFKYGAQVEKIGEGFSAKLQELVSSVALSLSFLSCVRCMSFVFSMTLGALC